MTADDSGTTRFRRRKFLAAAGSASAFGLAGCLGGGGNEGSQGTVPPVPDRNCDGVKPSLETAKSGKYTPLARPLFTYPAMSSLKEPQVAEFARYFTEKSADKSLVAEDVGYVPNTQEDMQAELDALNAAIEKAGGPAPGEAGDLSGDIAIAGSSTVFPLAEAVAEDFQKNHSSVSISVQSTGSGGGFQNFFCVGKTDFNNASRPMKKEEKQLCKDNGVQWHEINVATDALTVIVNNDNDWAQCLTVDELRQIWKPNAVSKWSDIHDEWPDEEIARFGAAETSGTFDYFTEAIVGEEGSHTSDYQATEKDNTIVSGVSGSTYAIGYLGFAYYSSNPDSVTAVAVDASE